MTCIHGLEVSSPWKPGTCFRCSRLIQPLEWISTAQLAEDSVKLAALLPLDTSGIVGIPRSGMMVAGIISTYLHLPLWELPEGGTLHRLGFGSRGRNTGLYASAGPLAVVDDTVYSGSAMNVARQAMKGKESIFAAVYVRREAAHTVDLYTRLLPSPHLLAWNVVNCGVAFGWASDPIFKNGIGFDIDGILIHDAQSGGKVGSPFMVPRKHPVPLIVTGRTEAYRKETEAILGAIGAKWDRLEMTPNDWKDGPAAWKAKHYGESKCGFFVESDPGQAKEINDRTGKPVICPVVGKVFNNKTNQQVSVMKPCGQCGKANKEALLAGRDQTRAALGK